jgi:hypothetical protein
MAPASLFFAACTENSASPTDAIVPDNVWLSGAGCPWLAPGRARSGVDHAAMVKQTTNSVTKHIDARNRIAFPPFDLDREGKAVQEVNQTMRKFRVRRKHF